MTLPDFGEFAMICRSLSVHALGAGLTVEDLETMLGLQEGAWPPSERSMDSASEMRVRRVEEIVRHVLALMGEDAKPWFRRPSGPDGLAPVSRLATDPDWVRRLRDELRTERGM